MTRENELESWQDHLEAVLPVDGERPLVVRVYRETRSTQDVARGFAPRRALVVADHQSGGRGRLGRAWLSRPGASVLMSVCWPVDAMDRTHDQVSLLVGVALARAVKQLAPDAAVRLKWPNDVLVEQRKLAGILIEATAQAFIIGVGLNVTREACPDDALSPSTICLEALGYNAGRLAVIQTLYREIDTALSAMDLKQTLGEWRTHATLGQTHTFEHNNRRITGEVVDLDPDHGLVIRRDTGEMIVLPAATTSVVG